MTEHRNRLPGIAPKSIQKHPPNTQPARPLDPLVHPWQPGALPDKATPTVTVMMIEAMMQPPGLS